MGFEVIQSVGKYQYIYFAESYRNSEGKPRQTRTAIGKVDPGTGEKVYKEWYLRQQQEQGKMPEAGAKEKMFSIDDVKKSSVRSYGLYYLLRSIGERIGLLDALSASMRSCWQEVFMLACYMIATGDPLMYCADWIRSTESLKVSDMSSQRISELLRTISPEWRTCFYQLWCGKNSCEEYLALDITSCSSYSELIEDVEWGYNRDHENLPQINLCLLMGERTRLPLYQVSYSGSLKDVSTLKSTLSGLEEVVGEKPVLVVMDKGFYSRQNVTRMLGTEQEPGIRFLISVPFTCAFAKKQVESERKDIDCVENTIVINGYSLRAVSKKRVWSNGAKVYVHVYYSAKKVSGMRENLYTHVSLLREAAMENPGKYIGDEEACKYLHIRKSANEECGYTINIKKAALEESLALAGWVVLLSNDIDDAKRAMQVYRDKDVVEKGFQRMKNSIDLGRLRVHSQDGMQNKLFIGFVATILMAEVNRVMAENGLYKTYTMKELLLLMARQRIQDIGSKSIIYPTTKEQRRVYDAFRLPLPL